jgi:hypothetical protein
MVRSLKRLMHEINITMGDREMTRLADCQAKQSSYASVHQHKLVLDNLGYTETAYQKDFGAYRTRWML